MCHIVYVYVLTQQTHTHRVGSVWNMFISCCWYFLHTYSLGMDMLCQWMSRGRTHCMHTLILTLMYVVHTCTHMMVLKTVTGILDYGVWSRYDGPLYSLHSLREVSPLVMVLFEKFPSSWRVYTGNMLTQCMCPYQKNSCNGKLTKIGHWPSYGTLRHNKKQCIYLS